MSGHNPNPISITLTPTESRFLTLLDQFSRTGRKQIDLEKTAIAALTSSHGHQKVTEGAELSDAQSKEVKDLVEKIREVRDVDLVECRIAGGWVRDKLLNLPSCDLDVTLSSISGYPFALAFVTWLHTLFPSTPDPSSSSAPNQPSTSSSTTAPIDSTSYSLNPSDSLISSSLSSIGKVAANPSQSKHLETATTRIMGLELDFVALRSESYADGSRIPSEVRLGTPEEDALRRDITINTLFYNVHTRLIEDHTHLGLSDLSNGIIRTPLPPIQTFRDDPLRILRCVRFASRFGFGLVDELEGALGDQEILEALRTRISRERVGIEVEKMLKGPDPLLAIKMMTTNTTPTSTYNLYPHIFIIPSAPYSNNPCPAPHPTDQAFIAAQTLTNLLPGGTWNSHVHPAVFERTRDGSNGNGKDKEKEREKEREKYLWLACCLAPYRGGMVQEKKNSTPMAEVLVRDSLKLGNNDKNGVNRLFAAATSLSHPKVDYPGETIRSSLGILLRQTCVHDAVTDTHWTTSLLFSMVMDLLPLINLADCKSLPPDAIAVFQTYHTFIDRIYSLGLPSALDDKPRLDGKEINTVLEMKASALTGVILQKVIGWQLDNPEASKEDCKAWLLKEKEAGIIEVLKAGENMAGRANKKQKKA